MTARSLVLIWIQIVLPSISERRTKRSAVLQKLIETAGLETCSMDRILPHGFAVEDRASVCHPRHLGTMLCVGVSFNAASRKGLGGPVSVRRYDGDRALTHSRQAPERFAPTHLSSWLSPPLKNVSGDSPMVESGAMPGLAPRPVSRCLSATWQARDTPAVTFRQFRLSRSFGNANRRACIPRLHTSNGQIPSRVVHASTS